MRVTASSEVLFAAPGMIAGVGEDDQALLSKMVDVWSTKYTRNQVRTAYYEGKNPVKDLGISIPPSMDRINTVVGWPAKAVDQLAAHSIFDGFLTSQAESDPFHLRAIFDANNFKSLYQQAVRSQLVHSVAFWTVSHGRKDLGEPEVMISVRSAEFAAALWDTRRKRIAAGLAITDTMISPVNQALVPSEVTAYFDEVTLVFDVTDPQWEIVDRIDHGLGRPMMEPMPFRPSEMRPFGNSRITREVMSITDSAQRAALRAEVLMEFNTAPQKYLMGANEDTFDGRKWKAYLSEILAISKDEDGDTPTFGQLPQLTPQGAIDYFAHLAARFSAATGVPATSLGLVTGSPNSSKGWERTKDDLVKIAEELNDDNEGVLGNVARLVMAVRDNLMWADLPDEAWSMVGQFRNAANPSIVSQSDAMVKQIAAIPWLADTKVALQELGYTDSQITRLEAEKRKAEGGGLLDRMARLETPDRLQIDDLGQVIS